MRGKGVRRGESGWRELLGRFSGSGLTVDGFCRREGIAVASFYRWRAVLGFSGSSGNAEQPVALALPRSVPGFVDLGAMRVSSPRVELHLELGDGIRVQLVRG
ncbi:MAG TPA: IS66 family insertion sequence element accessory protein TnpB [Burkholderiales bacterium]|nr:IS66 family insertion sequence element accessory protein TnpB [Burkholderiales bacterium]